MIPGFFVFTDGSLNQLVNADSTANRVIVQYIQSMQDPKGILSIHIIHHSIAEHVRLVACLCSTKRGAASAKKNASSGSSQGSSRNGISVKH